jgi:ubiquinone biosynthesis protein COQ9
LSVEEKTRLLIMERLRMNTEIKHQWQGVSFARNCIAYG